MSTVNNIYANLAFCIPLGLLMLFLFIHYRSALPIFYHRNVLCHGKPVLGFKVKLGFWAWCKELLGASDALLLRVAGLDALVTSNAFRLLFVFACIMAVPCLLLLAPYYYYNSDHSGKIDYETFTIADLHTDTFWPPLLVLIFLTVLVMYGVYTFYCNFVELRQAYLMRPSSLDSVGLILRNAELLGSLKASRRRLDASTCTVLLYSVPPNFCGSAEDLQRNLEKSGIAGLKSVQFVGDYDKLKNAFEARNASLAKLEKKLKRFTDALRKQQTKENSETASAEASFTVKERSDLLKKLVLDPSMHADIRPRSNKKLSADSKTAESVDSLQFYHTELLEREEKLQEALKAFDNPIIKTKGQQANEDEISHTKDFEQRYIEETALISWDKVKDFKSTKSHASSLNATQAALLHFSDFRQACRAQQVLLTSQANVMGSMIATEPNAICWKFINENERTRWTRAFKSNCYYWGFVLIFAPVSAAICSFINTEALSKWFPALKAFRESHPHVKEILEGFLAPIVASYVFNQTATCVQYIIAMRGNMTKAELALKSQSAHLAFLTFEAILIGALFANTHELVSTFFLSGSSRVSIFDRLRLSIPKNSHFFFNFMIQDIFNELMLALLNPKELFIDRSYHNVSGREVKSVRDLVEHDLTPGELGIFETWSRLIVFPYFIFMIYVIISPLIIIPAVAYFAWAYFVFRFRATQYARREVETGGMFWKQGSQQLIYGLIMAQLSVLLQYTQFRKGLAPSIIIGILLTLTILFIPFLNRHFGRICDSLSVLEDDIQRTKLTVQAHVRDQNKLIPGAIENFENSSLVKSHLKSDIKEHYNFSDIDPLVEKVESPPISNVEVVDEEEDISGITDEGFVSIVPLNFAADNPEIESGTFDPLQVDALVDVNHINNQYEHPLILKHSQVLMIPSDLPSLLKNTIQ